MSLAHAAEYLKKHGRGKDDQLVHMSKREVKGLQELAMAHGGSLTINPHTGLPEAGFLENILPTIIGVGLSVASGGALTPLMAAGITGAGYGLATGDLNKGLMAGLGAYGGAGLGAGLTSAGSAAAQATADTATSAAANQAAQTAGQEVATNAATNAATQGIDTAGQDYVKRLAMEQAGDAVPRAMAAAPASTNIGGNLTQAGQGVTALGNQAGRSAFMSGMSNAAPYATPALGFSAVNAAAPEQKVPGAPGPDQYDKRLAGYKLADNYKAYEAPRPNPYYSAQYQNYAAGGITGMSPQTNFANPSSYEEGTSQYSMATDPYSGNIANRMAEGGVTGGGEMQLNVPISIGGGGGGLGGGGGGYGGYSSGAGYAPPGGPQGGSAGSLASLGRGAQQMQPPGAAPQAQGAQAQGAQMNMQDNAQSAQGMSADVNGFTPIQTNQGTLLAGQFLQGLSGIPQDQKAGGAMGSQYGMQAQSNNAYAPQPILGMARGGLAYARGGHLSASAGIPDTGIYSDSDLTTRSEQALGASNAKLAQLYKRAGLKYAAGPKGGIEKLGGGFSEYGASGGLSHLGGYSDGGRMLKGPGDGMSDDIPAMIGKKQPARLADGEFVVPADVVSHLGNGSTDAGAKKLYGMMDKIRKARTGKKAQGKQINPNKFLPS